MKTLRKVPAKGDKDDMRCGLMRQKISGAPVECEQVTGEDWCHGCGF